MNSRLSVGFEVVGFLFVLITEVPPVASAGDYPIRPVPFSDVTIAGGFWAGRIDTNTEVTVPRCFERCEETGRIGNFIAAANHDPDAFQGLHYDDSDVFKIVEGASYSLALRPDPKLDAYLDDLIAKFAAAQEADGYLYTIRTAGSSGRYGPGPRWAELSASHELYNVGHLYEAAAAHFQATGKRTLLDIAIRNADLIVNVFGPDPQQLHDVPGHQEIELGLVRLHRVTGRPEYLKLAQYFVEMRGRRDVRGQVYGEYAQDHAPIRTQSEAVGHAVRGGYYYAAVADVAALTDDPELIAAIDGIWQDVVERKMYLTGSVGQHGAGEGYAGAWRLSNLKAYNETCASIAIALWNHRMFLLHGDARYIDVLERTLYNGVLSGVSLTGDRFFYPNPLECDMKFPFNHGSFERSPWFGTSCCPSNIARFIPSVPGYVFATRDDDVYINLFTTCRTELEVAGHSLTLEQETDYPWDGRIRIHVQPSDPGRFTLRLRIPGWARGEVLPGELYHYVDSQPVSWTIDVNGEFQSVPVESGYAVLNREWKQDDIVELVLPMPIRCVRARSEVLPDTGRVAFERGPLVYCAEGVDHDGRVLNLILPQDTELTAEHRRDLLGGITVLTGTASAAEVDQSGGIDTTSRPVTLIPYYAWCHRGPNEMEVWFPESLSVVPLPPQPTMASRSRPSASHCWQLDTVRALNDQLEPESSIDHDIPRLTWWDHRGTAEWVQYDFAAPARLNAIDVYWFDDTGRGQCRLPAAWSLLYREGADWKPVQTKGPQKTQRDQFNTLHFAPVTTSALRLEVRLQDGFSGGILEWRVSEAEQ